MVRSAAGRALLVPRDRFSPRSTVYNIFRKLRRDGVREAIRLALYMALSERMGRQASSSVAVLDSQSVKSSEKGAVETARWVATLAKGQGRKVHTLVILPRRWVTEHTFSWFGRNRRLATDFENLAETFTAFVTLAPIQLALSGLSGSRSISTGRGAQVPSPAANGYCGFVVSTKRQIACGHRLETGAIRPRLTKLLERDQQSVLLTGLRQPLPAHPGYHIPKARQDRAY